MLARPEYVGEPEPLLARALVGAPEAILFHASGAGVPRLGHAAWLLAQMRRWGDHQPDVAVRIDPGFRQPVAQGVGVDRVRVDRRQRQGSLARRAALVDHLPERRGGADCHGVRIQRAHPARKTARHADGAAVQVQSHGRDQVDPLAADPEGRGQGHGPQHVGAVQQPRLDLVADGGPGGLAHQAHLQPLGRKEAHGVGDSQRRAVRQRDETQAQVPAGHGALPFSTSA